MNIDEKVKELLVELSGEEEIGRGDTLQNDLALDSLSMVTLLLEIEEAFGIELKESDMNPMDLVTVRDVMDLVWRYYGDGDA